MKSSPCLAGALFALFACAASAQSSVTIFGIADTAVRHVKNGSLPSTNSLISGGTASSRVGLRGIEDLGAGLRVGFWLESDVALDTGASNATLWNRRSTLSLSSATAGEVRVGRDMVPSHVASCAIDPFACVGMLSATDYRSAQSAVFTGVGGVQLAFRANNSISYLTPDTLGGFAAQASFSAREGQVSAGTENSRGQGLRLAYRSGPVVVQAATWRVKNTTAAVQDFKDDVIGASYDFGVVKLGLQRRNFSFSAEKLAVSMAHLSIPAGSGVFKFTYMLANQKSPNARTNSADSATYGVGYQYNLSKRTSLYTTLGRVSNKGTAVFSIPGGANVTAANFGGQNSTGYEVGMRHDF